MKNRNEDLLQAPRSLKNAAAAIEERLFQRGYRFTEARSFVAPLYELVENYGFWKSQGPGLALFASAQGVRAYRLRGAPDGNWWLGTRYRVLPLLAPSEVEIPFYLLAVSANEVTFYSGSNDGLQPLPIENLPQGLSDTLQLDRPESLIQVMNTPVGATFHGQGPQIDRKKSDLQDYFRRIDRALHPYLAESRRPLIFAGVEYLYPIFREANTYAHLFDVRLCGNPERMGVEELRRRAAELLEPCRRSSFEQDARRFEEGVGAQRTADRMAIVLDAAHQGAVEALFVGEGETAWGRFNPAALTLDMTYADDPIADDLYDLAAFQTVLHGGRVHVVKQGEVPHGGTMAALLRYPLPVTVEITSEDPLPPWQSRIS